MNKAIKSISSLLCLTFIILCFSSCGAVPEPVISRVENSVEVLKNYCQINTDQALLKPVPQGNAFFQDSVFVGDSVTLMLKNYTTEKRNNGDICLANAEFLCSGSMSYTNAIRSLDSSDGIHPKLNGKSVMIDDGVKELNAKKVFIMLGMNDFCLDSFETGVDNAETMINSIIEKNPDTEIYVQSVTPIIASKEHGSFTNENVDAFNEVLKEMVEKNGWTFIDVNSVFKDENNCLKDEYCSDSESQGIHFNKEACQIWVDYLATLF